MRALVLEGPGGLERLAVREVAPPPAPGPGTVQLAVRAAALNHLDVFVAHGLPGLTLTYPHVVGTDAAGEVVAVGPGVTNVAVGDRVMVNPGVVPDGTPDDADDPLVPGFGILGEHAPGLCAENVVVPARNVARMPDAMPWAQGAAFSLATLTAWRMLVTRARLQAGETVLVWGVGGGVALACVRIAAHLGATVIATSSSPAKLQVAFDHGATHLLRHDEDDVVTAVRRATGGRGADVVVDSVGEATWERTLRAVRRGGRVVVCGATSGPQVALDLRRLFWHQWELVGSTMGNRREHAELVRLAGLGHLWPVVDAVVPLDEGPAAVRRLAAGAQAGKIVIEVT